MGAVISSTPREKGLAVSTKVKHTHTSDSAIPLLRTYPTQMCIHAHTYAN